MNNCKFCNCAFVESANQSGRQVYCSKQCREKDWRLNNINRVIEHGRNAHIRHLEQTPRFCKICSKKLTNHARTKFNGRFCSIVCAKVSALNTRKQRNADSRSKGLEITEAFHKYKCGLGCSKCGYNKFGGSLDFHHKNPSKKDFRIDKKRWHTQSSAVKNEMKKCVLLCKNCHYEEHAIMRKNGDIGEYE